MQKKEIRIPDPDDHILVKGCLNNNRYSQELLYRKYASKMYHICLSYTGDRDTAKDVLQESFIKIFRGIDKFNIENSLEGWIRKIVNNTAIDYFRKQRRIGYFENIEESVNQQYLSVEEVSSDMNTEVILRCIRKLPEGARMVFHLFAIEGYSHKEIAIRLNISEGTSKSQYNRARTLLQEWMQRSA